MALIHRRRSLTISVAALIVVAGTLSLAGIASASSTRTYTATVTSGCAAIGQPTQFTVTIKNTGSVVLGSAKVDTSSITGLKNSTPDAATVMTSRNLPWSITADNDADGIYLKSGSGSTANALQPGDTVTATFTGKPSTLGTMTWETSAWQGTGLSSWGFTRTNAAPTTTVKSSCEVKPTILTNPNNVHIVQGDDASFTSTASGTAPSVQWQFSDDNGNSYSPVFDGIGISGSTTTTLLLQGVPAGWTMYRYRAVFTNGAGTATSTAATLTVDAHGAATDISTSFATSSVAPGGQVSYTITATDRFGNTWDATQDAIFGFSPTSPSGSCVLNGVPGGPGNNLCSNTILGSYTVTASLAGTPGAQATLNVDLPGDAHSLSFLSADGGQQPTDTLFGAPITPDVKVAVFDKYGNLVKNAAVDLSIVSGSGDPSPFTVLTCPATCEAVSGDGTAGHPFGIAVFSGLSINNPSSGYQFVATAALDNPPGATTTPTNPSAKFDILSAQSADCSTGCDVTGVSPDGSGSVQVISGGGSTPLKIVFESQPLPGCGVGNDLVAQTWTIDPPAGSGVNTVVFVNELPGVSQGLYDICKTVEQGGTTTSTFVGFCDDLTAAHVLDPDAPLGLDMDPTGGLPCIVNQTAETTTTSHFTLTSTVLITDTDPGFKSPLH